MSVTAWRLMICYSTFVFLAQHSTKGLSELLGDHRSKRFWDYK